MSYNRFIVILNCLYFIDNNVVKENTDRLYWVKPLIDIILQNTSLYAPGPMSVV